MDLYLNDERTQFIREGFVFKPGKNIIDDKEWNELKTHPWVKHLIDNGILSEKHPLSSFEINDNTEKIIPSGSVPINIRKEKGK